MNAALAFLGRNALLILTLASILALFGTVALVCVLLALAVGWALHNPRDPRLLAVLGWCERVYDVTGARMRFHVALVAVFAWLMRNALGYAAMGVLWLVFAYCLMSPQP